MISELSCGNRIGAVMMDLSKAFNSINHDLLLSKLKTYSFKKNSVSFIRSYFTIMYQLTKMCSTFNDWNKFITGVSQGSVLGPLFFNSFINDLFLFANKSEICSYTDDNTLYAANKNINQIISNISNDFGTLTKWFCDNYMVLNPVKFHFMTIGFQD